jgi:hypothetical protein
VRPQSVRTLSHWRMDLPNRRGEVLDCLLLFGWLLSQRDPIELLCEGVMRRPQVCKHQVCDHCGGRFGMVTYRWWGNKFCKRACKNAHRRENHHTQSGWVIPRFFTFAGGAAAVAVAMLTLLLASANAAPGEERPVTGSSLEFNKENGTLYIDWSRLRDRGKRPQPQRSFHHGADRHAGTTGNA